LKLRAFIALFLDSPLKALTSVKIQRQIADSTEFVRHILYLRSHRPPSPAKAQ